MRNTPTSLTIIITPRISIPLFPDRAAPEKANIPVPNKSKAFMSELSISLDSETLVTTAIVIIITVTKSNNNTEYVIF